MSTLKAILLGIDFSPSSRNALAHKTPGKAIAEIVRTLIVDLIVLGMRGTSNLHDILLGSIAEHVLGEAHRSILAIRTKA